MHDPMSNKPVVSEASTNRYHAFMVSIAKAQTPRPMIPSVGLPAARKVDQTDEARRLRNLEMEDPERWDGLS